MYAIMFSFCYKFVVLCMVIHIYGIPLDVVSDPFNSESAGPLTEGIPYVKSHLE